MAHVPCLRDPPAMAPTQVFVSYTATTPAEADRVRALVRALEGDGFGVTV